MNDTQLLERLSAAYQTIEVPAPSAALAELMDAGGVATPVDADGDRRDAVVVPFARPGTRIRMRYLVAALVASFVAVSGLAVAGALPDSLQRQVSSVVSHLGIDIPSPAPAHTDHTPGGSGGAGGTTGTDGSNTSGRPSSTSNGVPATGVDEPAGTPAAGTTLPGSTPTTTPVAPVLGEVGAVDGASTPPTTVPLSGDLGLPQLTLPPITVPQLTLPPITVPPISLPPLLPLPLPPLPLPPLPILGL